MSKNNVESSVSFNASKRDAELIDRIVEKACNLTNKHSSGYIENMSMDITACHCNGTPLDLEKFLNFDDFNFFHDLYGISFNVNRRTGKIENCFLPRCAR